MEKPTRIQETMDNYLNRSKNLMYRFREEKKISDYHAVDLREFVGWVIHRKQFWSRPSWRQNKSSVIYYLQTVNDPISEEALDLISGIESDGCVKKSNKTSSTKMKKFPLKDFQRIVETLEEAKSSQSWTIPLQRWIRCGLLVGLRPKEWETAYVSTTDNEPSLIVNNAKNTNGRAFGQTRTILLGMLSLEEIQMIKEHSDISREWHDSGQYKDYYMGCATTLSRVTRKIWPNRKNHITLYSTRHQFSANAKSSGLTREELAALMGHAVDDTAEIHYGRKKAGYDLLRVRPYPPDVKKIKPSKDRKVIIEPKPKPVPKLEPSDKKK